MSEAARLCSPGLVRITFSPEMARLVYAGKKCCTTRRKAKAKPGDVFPLYGWRYRVLDVIAMPLQQVVNDLHRLEGFDHPAGLSETIAALYPDLEGDDEVFVHFFAREG